MRLGSAAIASVFSFLIVPICAIAAESFAKPLPSESTSKVEILPAHYPSGWAFLNYAGNRIELRNVGADSREVKGHLLAHDNSSLLVADQRPEIYVSDTVYSRGNRGVRTDFITIYDKQTFNVVGEVVLPGTKRALITPMEGLITFTAEQSQMLVFNFTPASSVTVVDLLKRQVLSEVQIPGCSLVYPAGAHGFATLCGSGTLLTVQLDASGAVVGRSETKPFNLLDTDPLFTQSAALHGIRYFPSLHGRIQPVDMQAEDSKVLPAWNLVPASEAAEHWWPSGWQNIASDEKKLLYVLMQSGAHEGTHKNPADEVWVYDAMSQQRVKRVHLVHPGSSVALTHAEQPLMLVQSDARLDVYDTGSGALVRSLELTGFDTRMQIETVR